MLHVFLDDRPWFKPKLYGLGAFPATWQGWALTLAYVGLMIGMGVRHEDRGGAPDASWWAVVSIATLIFVVIAWRKTEGGWRWRWGNDDGDKGPGTGPGDGRRQPREKHRKRRG